MNFKINVILLSVCFNVTSAFSQTMDEWHQEQRTGYSLHVKERNAASIQSYTNLLDAGVTRVERFVVGRFPNSFGVFVHPNRQSLDAQWQKDWNMPEFKSECWMVASGVATRLDLISPTRWDQEACEHDPADTTATQQLVAHELFHVYHGQLNVSPDFSDIEGIDWLVEGFATYASGQCDAKRMAEVKRAAAANTIPRALDSLWTGKLRYGLAGSMVMYVDQTYGRSKLLRVLQFNKKQQVLGELGTTEAELIAGWVKFLQ